MPPEMLSFAPSVHSSLSSSVVLPCQHSLQPWAARRQRISLMRRKVELARQGFRLLELRSHSGSNAVPTARNQSEGRQAYRRADRQQGQVRCGFSSASVDNDWKSKQFKIRDERERSFVQPNLCYSSNSASSQVKQRGGGEGSAVAGRSPSNEAEIALQRGQPSGAVQRNSHLPSISAAEPAMPAVNGHSSRRAAPATQFSGADEDIALPQESLHTATLDHSSSVKVKTLFLVCQSTKCADTTRQLLRLQVLHALLNQVVCCRVVHR